MSSPVRIAVAGAGLIGQAHIKPIVEDPQAELAAIIDPSLKAQDQATSLGVPCFADLEIGLQSAKPDGVVIATPNQLHVPNGLTAVKAPASSAGSRDQTHCRCVSTPRWVRAS